MTYIALALITIIAIWFAVSHEEQKFKTEQYRRLVIQLKKENAALRDGTVDEEFMQLALKCFSK